MCIWCKGRANNTTQINTTYNTGFGILPLLSKGVILGTVRWHIQGLTYILILYNWFYIYIYIHVYKEHMCIWRKGRGNNTYTLTARGSWQQEIRYTAIDGWHNVNAVSCSACPGVSSTYKAFQDRLRAWRALGARLSWHHERPHLKSQPAPCARSP